MGLFKGCNKAPGPPAKGHSTQGFNNAAVHTALRGILKGRRTHWKHTSCTCWREWGHVLTQTQSCMRLLTKGRKLILRHVVTKEDDGEFSKYSDRGEVNTSQCVYQETTEIYSLKERESTEVKGRSENNLDYRETSVRPSKWPSLAIWVESTSSVREHYKPVWSWTPELQMYIKDKNTEVAFTLSSFGPL